MKTQSVSKLKKKADRLHSIKVRSSAANHQGYATCYTCGVKKVWQELQCSHFISRANNSLRYDPRNTKPACVKCNIFLHGNIPAFAAHLIKEYGAGIVETLVKEGKKVRQFTIKELLALIENYKI